MSSLIKKTVTAFGIIVLFLSLGFTKVQAHPGDRISLQTFYDELSYYGDWINNPDYGYVWRPNVGSDFRPYYTNGHWVMTEYGNTWVSDYDWGWAPFHYGRWFYDDYDGWVWAPDTAWGPAWVTWRTGGGYYGWAPLAPRISININIGRHYIPDNYWVFIPQRCIYYPSYGRYWEPRRNVYIVHNTTIINNIYTNRNVRYYSGPRPDDVRRATRQNVPVYRVADDSSPGATRVSRDAVNIYRPEVKNDGRSSTPRNIASNSARPSRSGDNSNSNVKDGDNYQRPQTSNAGRGVGDSRPEVNRTDNDRSSGSRSSRPDVSSQPAERNDRSEAPSRSERPAQSRPETSRQEPSSRTESSRKDSPSSRPQKVERSAPSSRSVERSSSSRENNSSRSSSRPTRKGD